jgi:hypothetical protein
VLLDLLSPKAPLSFPALQDLVPHGLKDRLMREAFPLPLKTWIEVVLIPPTSSLALSHKCPERTLHQSPETTQAGPQDKYQEQGEKAVASRHALNAIPGPHNERPELWWWRDQCRDCIVHNN